MKSSIGFLLLAACLPLVSCTANKVRQPGTGDVAFRLVWDGIADLDLSVRDPSGGCISYIERHSASGGELDIDCNGSSDLVCEHPIENVYWPTNTAPDGEYLFWVRANSMTAEGPVPFRLQLLHGSQVFWEYQGTIDRPDGFQGPFRYSFPAGESAATLGTADRPCGAFTFFPAPAQGGVWK